jgi:hypothetical protein
MRIYELRLNDGGRSTNKKMFLDACASFVFLEDESPQ